MAIGVCAQMGDRPCSLRRQERRGVAQAIPWHRVLSGLEPISAHNRRVTLQKWLAEA
jgi:hypothetical protein